MASRAARAFARREACRQTRIEAVEAASAAVKAIRARSRGKDGAASPMVRAATANRAHAKATAAAQGGGNGAMSRERRSNTE